MKAKAWALATCLSLVAPSAGAQQTDDLCDPQDRFSTCVGSDNLWPQPGGAPLFTVAPTQLPKALGVSAALVPTFYNRPIGFRVASADPDGTTIYAVERVLAAHALFGFAPMDGLQVQVAAPIFLFQDGAGKADAVGGDDRLPVAAFGDLRFGAQVTLLRREAAADGPGLSARFEMAVPSADGAAFAGWASTTWAPGVAFDWRIGRVLLAADASGRFRRDVPLAGTNLGSQLGLNVGVSVDILDDGWLSAGAELWSLFTLIQQTELVAEPGDLTADVEPTGVPHIPLEYLLSLRTSGLMNGRLRLSAGAGGLIPTGPTTAVTTPNVRAVLGIHYVHDGL